MLTLAISLLFVAIFVGVLGFLVAGPVGPILFAVFFAGFVLALARYLGSRDRGPRP